MTKQTSSFSPRQLLFKELVMGTLIYAVILGFFDDYSSMVHISSFSSVFYAAFVLSVLTYFVLLVKTKIVLGFKDKKEAKYRILLVFCVWFVMFASKFVFLWVIDFVFDSNVNINGFFAILILALCATVVQRVTDYIFVRLQ